MKHEQNCHFECKDTDCGVLVTSCTCPSSTPPPAPLSEATGTERTGVEEQCEKCGAGVYDNECVGCGEYRTQCNCESLQDGIAMSEPIPEDKTPCVCETCEEHNQPIPEVKSHEIFCRLNEEYWKEPKWRSFKCSCIREHCYQKEYYECKDKSCKNKHVDGRCIHGYCGTASECKGIKRNHDGMMGGVGDYDTEEDIVLSEPIPEEWEEKIKEIKSRYPESINIEGLEPAFSSDIMEIIAQAKTEGRKDERQAWLKGDRCAWCGEEQSNQLADMYGKCLEEA